jgi:hypothetical protein
MILTWLWKMLRGFQQRRATPALEAPKGPGRLGEERGFVNRSSEADNSGR